MYLDCTHYTVVTSTIFFCSILIDLNISLFVCINKLWEGEGGWGGVGWVGGRSRGGNKVGVGGLSWVSKRLSYTQGCARRTLACPKIYTFTSIS